MKGLIIWRYYQDGKLVNSSVDVFEGIAEGLQRIAEDNFQGNRGAHEMGREIKVFHNFVSLEEG